MIATLLAAVLVSVPFPYGVVRAEEAAPAQGQEEEFLIVKYGAVYVKSPIPESVVYIDGLSAGSANAVVENVVAGEHTIACTAGDKNITGTFIVRKNETLRLEARFNEARLVVSAVEQEGAAKKKRDADAARAEQQKKAAAEAKKPEPAPTDEKGPLHLHVFSVEFKNLNAQDVAVTEKLDPKILSGYVEKKSRTGKYYRTKKGLLLCEEEPCVQEWVAKFFYTDETSKRDSFLITWKQTTFSGMTPTGTNGRELIWCLNGNCRKMTATGADKSTQSAELGRYVLRWSKDAARVRRADIMKKIQDEGGIVPE